MCIKNFFKCVKDHHKYLSIRDLQVLCQVILGIQKCDVKGWNENN